MAKNNKIVKTLGGERLGSGNKMKVSLHTYGRSSFNIGRYFKTDQACGPIVPMFVDVATNGTDYYIDLTTKVRTLPTNGPIFGSFKHQIDVFSIPIRLYNAQLHNNALYIGLKMSQVLLPTVTYTVQKTDPTSKTPINAQQIAQDSLTAYLGIRGLGKKNAETSVGRNFPAIFELAYWDIFKNYYANKQEENAYVIGSTQVSNNNKNIARITLRAWRDPADVNSELITTTITQEDPIIKKSIQMQTMANNNNYVKAPSLTVEIYSADVEGDPIRTVQSLTIKAPNGKSGTEYQTIESIFPAADMEGYWTYTNLGSDGTVWRIQIAQTGKTNDTVILAWNSGDNMLGIQRGEIDLISFPLKNIDDMREKILQAPKGIPFNITSENMLPYSATSGRKTTNNELDPTGNGAYFTQAGLAVRTYLSDRFNNWLSMETIEGVNGINEITAIPVVDGKIKIDTLIARKKVYDMMNRFAIGDGTYHDWQEIAYGQRMAYLPESPVYEGGMSSEITFDEVVSSAAAENADGNNEPLGSLAGRGSDKAFKGGKSIHVHIEEPSILMIVGSIVPRVTYSEGNKWYTELENMDDLHKPALDAIGFQDLTTEEFAAWDTIVGPAGVLTKHSVGKQPSWIEQQTNTDESFGDFSAGMPLEHLSVNRRYTPNENGSIQDATTYIDPRLYNTAFADAKLSAKNFWVQCQIDCIARRVMSSKQIPNL